MVIDLFIHEEELGLFNLFIVVWSGDKPSIISVALVESFAEAVLFWLVKFSQGLLDSSAQALLFWLAKSSQLLISSDRGTETSGEIVDNLWSTAR